MYNNTHAVETLLAEFSIAQDRIQALSVTEANVHELLALAAIDPEEELPPPPVCLEIKQGSGISVIGTRGNFSLVIGKAKSRKTFLIALLLAALLRCKIGHMSDRAQDIVGSLPDDKCHVLHFDTEQGQYHVQKVVKRVLKLSGKQKNVRFTSYCLRKYSPAERLQLIEYALYNTPNVGFVVIDGIRDLVSSINDEETATMMASKLLKWTEELNIHILCVLHQNKGDNNARGHLGTELQNKAETVVSVTKNADNKEISTVEAEYCREKEFEPFAFGIDDQGLPYIEEDWSPKKKEAGGSKSVAPGSLEPQQHKEILTAAFHPSKPTYRDLVFRIKTRMQFGDSRAKDYISYYKDKGYIETAGKEGTKACYYTLSQLV